MALDTVQDYITQARVQLQDARVPYRYEDADFISGLNLGLFEARRARPDLFIGKLGAVPAYVIVTTPVDFDQQYRQPLMYYIVGHVGMRDQEPSQDGRAASYIAMFKAALTKQGA